VTPGEEEKSDVYVEKEGEEKREGGKV